MDDEKKIPEEIKCGIIMPISPIDGCTTEHWAEVKNIFIEATSSISEYKFNTLIVSEADDIGIIQKRIVQNVYNSDIIICDVSGKNPNVMFELGMRLAFDKPTVIVKDDQTGYSFDTGIIEHLEYPRDLRFFKIVEFKKKLNQRLIATIQEASKNIEYSTFLKSFGQFKVSTLSEHEVSSDTAILQSIEDLRHEVYRLRSDSRKVARSSKYPSEVVIRTKKVIDDCFKELGVTKIEDVVNNINLYTRVLEETRPSTFFDEESQFKEFYEYILSTYK